MQNIKTIAASIGLVLISSSAFSDFGSWTRNKAAGQVVQQEAAEEHEAETNEPTPQIKQEPKPQVKQENKPVFIPPTNPQTNNTQNHTDQPRARAYTPPVFSAPQNTQPSNDQMQKEADLELSRFHASMATMKNIESQKGISIPPEQRIALSVLNATLMQAEFDSSSQTKTVYVQAVGCVNSYGNPALNSAAQQLINSKINGNASKVIYGSPSIGSNHSQRCAYQQ